MENRKYVNLDFSKTTQTDFWFVQGDQGADVIEISVTDNEEPKDIVGQDITVTFTKPDGKLVIQDDSKGVKVIDAKNGILECTLLGQVLGCAGIVKCNITFKDKEKILSTGNFRFTVLNNTSSSVLSKNIIPTIDRYLAVITSNEENRQDVFNKNESNRQSVFNTNESTRQSTFNNSEQKRQSTFNANESTRQNEFDVIKTDYNTYRNVMTDESNVANLQNQINTVNSHLADMANDKLSTVTKSESVVDLPNATDGQLSFSLKGRTLKNLNLNLSYSWDSENSKGYYNWRDDISSIGSYTICNYSNYNIVITLLNSDNTENSVITIKSGEKRVVNNVKLKSYFSLLGTNGWTSDNIKECKVLILEGDWTDKEVPQYFEGIKSVGENGNKIEVLSRGKNLVDINNITRAANCITTILNDNTINLITTEPSKFSYVYYKVYLTPNKKYTISFDFILKKGQNYIDISDSNSKTILSGSNKKYIFTTPADGVVKISLYCTFNIMQNGDITYSNIMLTEEEKATDYKPYRQDRIDILNTVLREWDSISEKGVKTVGTNVDIINENTDIETHSIKTNTMMFKCLVSQNVKGSDVGGSAICNNFPYRDFREIYMSVDGFECVTVHSDVVQSIIYISINKSKLATPDEAGFKAWLAQNPVTVYYELATPITEQLPQPLTLQSFKGGSMIVNSAIPPQIEVNYPTSFATGVAQNANAIADNRTNIKSIYDALYLLTQEVQALKNSNSGEV